MIGAADSTAVLLASVDDAENRNAAKLIVQRILWAHRNGGVVYIFGNGGSAAQAAHFAAELVVRFEQKENRPAIAAIDLSSQNASMTACSNDLGPVEWPARFVEAMHQHDFLILLTTSCRSPNIIRAVERVMERRPHGPRFAGLYGQWPGRFAEMPEVMAPGLHPRINVPSPSVSAVQEATLHWIHRICADVELALRAKETPP